MTVLAVALGFVSADLTGAVEATTAAAAAAAARRNNWPWVVSLSHPVVAVQLCLNVAVAWVGHCTWGVNFVAS